MAILNARMFRPAVAALALGALMVVVPVHALAAPHGSPRTPASVPELQKSLGKLAYENTQLVEKFNQARVDAVTAEKTAAAAQAKAVKISASYVAERQQFVTIVQDQYEGSSLGAAGALLESSSNSDYVDRVSALGMVSTHVSQVIGQIAKARTSATQAAATAKKLYVSAKAERDALAAERTSVNKRIKDYQSKLATLTSAQRSAYLRAQTPSVDKASLVSHLTKASSAAAGKAVAFALAQVDKPYSFGASGPGSYDCSGLTMRAWQAGGVSLPHSAADQYNYGHHVSLDSLEPGDLVFMYHPIGHVTIYIGSGMMVSAPTEGQDVTVVPLSSYLHDIVGATRLTG